MSRKVLSPRMRVGSFVVAPQASASRFEVTDYFGFTPDAGGVLLFANGDVKAAQGLIVGAEYGSEADGKFHVYAVTNKAMSTKFRVRYLAVWPTNV